MRGNDRTKGKWDWTKGLLAVAALFGGALIVYPEAFATDPQIAELVAEIENDPARHRRLMALKSLVELDSAAARAAVVELAGSADDGVALAAVMTLSREDFPGARDALVAIVEDGARGDGVRRTALGAWLRHRKGDDRSWASTSDWVADRTTGNDALAGFAHDYASHLWGEEVVDAE